jgi:hypothetical protein
MILLLKMRYFPKVIFNNMKNNRNSILNDLKKYKGECDKRQVCLIGFQGSKEKHLQKYVDIYKDNNIDTLVYTPGYFTNYTPKYVNAIGEEIADQLKKNNKNIIFHCISGGAYPMSLTIKNLILDNKIDMVDKIIYDSSPVTCSLCSATRALTIVNPLPKIILEYLLRSYYVYVKLPISEWCYDFYSILGSPQLDNTKKLFIFSNTDPIIPIEELDDFLEGQRNFNLIKFENAEHTKNILNNEELYIKSINKFLKDKK